MEIKTYAPVVIPTLNRYDKLKVCLESLERCTWADHTLVYVAVDYPPSDKYREGWEKICSYLKQKVKENGFKELRVTYRDHNYGVGKPRSNSVVAAWEIKKIYDNYILTEDDNEFSPNFLMYMNYAFEKYKNDDRILMIAGYNYDNQYPDYFDGDYYLEQYQFFPWGYGTWKKITNILLPYNNLSFLKSIVKDKNRRNILRKKHPHTLEAIFTMLKRNKIQGDAIFECVMFLENKYIVVPRVSLVRNHGNDGSGVNNKGNNIKINDYFSNQLIDDRNYIKWNDKEFILEQSEIKQNFQIKRPWYRQLYKSIILRLDTFLLVHFDYIPKSRYL